MTARPEILFVYIPCAAKEEAKKIGRALVEERLAACTNIYDGPCSIYHWQGGVEEGEEALLIVKTRADLFEDLAARVTALHSYEVPCIAGLEIDCLNESYADWICDETERN